MVNKKSKLVATLLSKPSSAKTDGLYGAMFGGKKPTLTLTTTKKSMPSLVSTKKSMPSIVSSKQSKLVSMIGGKNKPIIKASKKTTPLKTSKKQVKPKVTIKVAKKKVSFAPTPASVCAQKMWGSLPKKVKTELRRNLPDTDKDGVPNGFDCRPRNKRKQESFLPEEETYLNNNQPITLGRKISTDKNGEVYSVADNTHLIVKVPLGFNNDGTRTIEDRLSLSTTSKVAIQEEGDQYASEGLEGEPLFIPTKVVNMGANDLNNGEYVGLVRSKVTPVIDYTNEAQSRGASRMTDTNLEDIRLKLVKLSQDGYAIKDGVQLGLDVANRPILYDYGSMIRFVPGDAQAYNINNSVWLYILDRLGKLDMNDRASYEAATLQYGTVSPDGNVAPIPTQSMPAAPQMPTTPQVSQQAPPEPQAPQQGLIRKDNLGGVNPARRVI